MDKTLTSAPFISVILPVYNAEKYLQKAINSILNQTYKNYELIIINDGSTDNSRKIIEGYSDKRIKIINKDNSGLIDSLNIAISLASGDWIARMDADDISYSNRLETQIRYFHEDVAVIGSQANIIDQNDNILTKTKFCINNDNIILQLIKKRPCIIHPSTIINKSKLIKIGGYDPKMKVAEDYDLWLRISKIGKLVNVNTPLLALRKHDSNISKVNLEKAIINSFISLTYYFRSESFQIITQNEYNYLKEKLVPHLTTICRISKDFELIKENFYNSPGLSKYLNAILTPQIISNFIRIRLLKKIILFKIKKKT